MNQFTRISKIFPILVCCAFTLFGNVYADFLITYAFNSGSPAAEVTGSEAGGVNADPFLKEGAASISSSTEMAFLRSSETGSNEADALADSDYFSVTLSAANPGEYLNLTSFEVEFGGTSGVSGPAYTSNIVIRADLGSGFTTLSAAPSSKSVSYSSGGGAFRSSVATVDISALDFDQLSSATFEIRFFDDVNDSNKIDRFDNVQFRGATVIPEPSSMLLVLSGVLAFGLSRRGKTRK